MLGICGIGWVCFDNGSVCMMGIYIYMVHTESMEHFLYLLCLFNVRQNVGHTFYKLALSLTEDQELLGHPLHLEV